MSRRKSPVLTDHELRLMEVLWRKERATVADVVEALAPPPLTYSTVLTTLRTLERKGHVTHEADGRAFVYRPSVQRGDAATSAVRHVLDRFFASSPGALAVALLDDARLSDGDLAQVKRILARRRKEKK
ncbi:MAG: BlaI/MecI/CopY family transcriptional regulator [Candidatus Eremiobacteraeota bacterium]|nr:BlaI/MecI/CopY family transcriptional regulator [Candidatus Eremiobacteraeota bacterium]MBV8497935.1 BlaI/MecI/CopY family transcriptional regulator [Candidatus Eremiobacteraeota bacterium]